MAISTSINYPHDALPVPLQEGYGLRPISPIARTQMTSGRARQRRRYTSTPTVATVDWLLTDSEAQAFEAWYRDAITDGAAWFNMNLRTPGGEAAKYVALRISTRGHFWKAETSGAIQLSLNYTSAHYFRLAGAISPGWLRAPTLSMWH